MITVIVTFQLPEPISREEARGIFLSTAPRYQDVPGLIRKYYLLSPDGCSAGGIYLWATRGAAEALYTAEWRAFVRGKYGSEPTVSFMDTPVVVDNLTQEIIADA